MAKALTIQDFFKKFPDDAACLAHLFSLRYGYDFKCPKCGVVGAFKKLLKQPAYTCNCGHHIHPMQGTIFQDTHTPLAKWFYAIYLFTTTRHGVPAKELQRQLGVSYPTAFRMAHLIRQHMARTDGDPSLGGHVEADETYVGGHRKGGTNSIEGYWSLIKRSIRGTHVHVSAKHLQKYLGEFEFRYNLRHSPQVMFVRLLASF
jgi:predicted RNA-binding Zn-ribbon protein involved in translation (DUF1610 family)